MQAVKETRTLYLPTLHKYMFEIVLKTDYQAIHASSHVQQYMDKKPGGLGFSPYRLSQVPLREMMKRVLPDTSVSKLQNNYKVQVNTLSPSK